MPKHNDIVKLEPQGWLVGDIRSCIFTIRGTQVMLDKDLAVFYGVSTSRLNEQVKRNIKRFPERYRFQLTQAELNELIANCDRLKTMKHVPSLPYAFTEQGVSQLSSVLKSSRCSARSSRCSTRSSRCGSKKQHKTRCMETAFNTYHQQYPSEHVELHVFNHSHDRWLIVDEEVYHFGASIKDLGKKWFEVSQITEYSADELLSRLNK